MAAALALTRFITAFLFGVNALDPIVFMAVPILLSGLALGPVWLLALRANRVDPINTLRYE